MNPLALVLAILPAALTLPACSNTGESPAGATAADHLGVVAVNTSSPLGPTVGIDRTELLRAYYASDLHSADLDRLRRARDAAPQGDRAAIEQLGGEMQSIAHAQLAGEQPLYPVVGRLYPFIEEVMERGGYARIVLVHEAPGLADVTPEVVEMIATAPN